VFSPDGKRIVSAAGDEVESAINVWDATNGSQSLALRGHSAKVISLAVSADGKRIVSGDENGTVKVWDAKSGHELLSFRGNPDGSDESEESGQSILSVAFSGDAKQLAWATENGVTILGPRP
jgi:WD40 repeat protein